MSSHARPGSAPRPAGPPHPDAPYQDAGYDGYTGYAGYDRAAEAQSAYGTDTYGSYDSFAEGPASAAFASAGYAADGYGAAVADGYGYGDSGSDYSGSAYGSPASDDSTSEYGAAGYSTSGYSASAYSAAGYGADVPGSGSGSGSAYMADAPDPRDASRQAAAQDGPRAPRPTRAQARAAARARARRKRLKRTSFLGVGSVAAVAVIAVAGFVNPHHGSGSAAAQADASAAPVAGRTGDGDASRSVDRATPAAALKQLPGLGPGFLAKVPAGTQQVLLVTGKAKDQNTGTAVLYTRTAAGGWIAGPSWAARNAKNGWTTDHHAGDLHSPIGVFSLTDAGGLDGNPGTKLPYTHSSAFQAPGTGFEGESLADAFDYVVAINYNHVPGTSPLSEQRPMGASRGGGIWVHVDHGGPTHGCVALAKDDMRALLQALDPSKRPVIVMGDAASLAQ